MTDFIKNIGTYRWKNGENGWKVPCRISGRELANYISRGTNWHVKNQSEIIKMTDFIMNIWTFRWKNGENGWKYTWRISGRELANYISCGAKRHVKNQSKIIKMTDFIKNIGIYRWKNAEMAENSRGASRDVN